MRKLGLWAVRPKRSTSKPQPAHKVYPYLLRQDDRPAEPGVGDRNLHPDVARGFCTWS
jgi:hypothetical protein